MNPKKISGLYAITPDADALGNLAEGVEDCLKGGASVIQYRNKTVGAPHLAMVKALAYLCKQFEVPLIVNDDIDLALAAGADGVHLGRDDDAVALARSKLGAASIIGVSCYDDLQLALKAQQEGADYVAFGSMFASFTKPQAPHAPLTLLGDANGRLDIPVVAIGGITLQNAPLAIAAGADAIAVISAVFDAPDVIRAARDLSNLFRLN